MMHIFGCGGHSLIFLDILEDANIQDILFYDDDPNITENAYMGYPFKGPIKNCTPNNNQDIFIVAIGCNRTRKNIYLRFKSKIKPCSLIHKKATISSYATIQSGSVVFAGAIINRNAKVHENVIINTGAIIEHECSIGAHTHIAPSATLCGQVKIGRECLIGANATILPNIKIGNNSIVGAGAIVTKNVPSATVVKNVY